MSITSLIAKSAESIKLIELFQRRNFTIKDSKLTYRALNHYKKTKMIDENKLKQESWRKFSGIELIWIDIIIQLRELGISLEKILLIKKHLFIDGYLGSIDRAQFISNSFEHEIALAVLNKYDLYLLIFSDFSCAFRDSQSIKQGDIKYRDVPYINIPMSRIIKETLLKVGKPN